MGFPCAGLPKIAPRHSKISHATHSFFCNGTHFATLRTEQEGGRGDARGAGWSGEVGDGNGTVFTVVRVELPRLQMSFAPRLKEGTSSMALHSEDFSGLFVSERGGAQCVAICARVPHSLLMEDSGGRLSLLVPNYLLGRRLSAEDKEKRRREREVGFHFIFFPVVDCTPFSTARVVLCLQ